MNIAVVEDLEVAHDNVACYLRESHLAEEQRIKHIGELSKRIKFDSDFYHLLKHLRCFEGELILIIDLGLDLPPSAKDDLRKKYAIDVAIKDVQVDGVVVALEAIANTKISPALITIATSHGHQAEIEEFLKTAIAQQKRDKTVQLEFSPRGFTLAHQERAGEILDFAIQQFNAHFGKRFDTFLETIQTFHHDCCDSPKGDALLAELLMLSHEQFSTSFNGHRQILRDALKTMGSQCHRPLSAVGAWLLALAAYRHQLPQVKWEQALHTFSLESLQAELNYCKLLPSQKPGTLNTSIRIFYELCCRLFEAKFAIHAGQGPLLQVRFSAEMGLRFWLDFPCTGNPMSLQNLLVDCAQASLRGKALPQHQTSLAVWRFWLASSIADKEPLGPEGLFGTIWGINILPLENKKTEVVFYV